MKVSTTSRVQASPSRGMVVRVVASSSANSVKAARRALGKSNLEVSEMGLGAWSWGDRSGYWGWKGTFFFSTLI